MGGREGFDTLDFLTDASILADPYPYYDHLRQCPARHVPPHDIVAVSGYDEAVDVWRDVSMYSSCNSTAGPFPRLVSEPGADDVGALLEASRDLFALTEHMTTFDPPRHTAHRALMMRLMTPRRLIDSEEFMWRLAESLMDGFHDAGRCDFIAAYAYPYALLRIAHLLGVPECVHQHFLH